MRHTIRALTDNLARRGIALHRIPICVRDLGHIVAEKPSASSEEIDQEMATKGWQQFHADESTIFLILLIVAETLIEAEPGQRVWFELPVPASNEEHPVP